MVIDYRLAATFTHRHHIMQTEHYIFFVAVAFTLKITLTDRAHMSHQTLIRVLRPLRMRAPSLKHPNRTFSFPRGNLILARGRSSVRPETRTHSELWCESGPVPFGVLPECTDAPARCFSTSPSHLALPGESCPLSDWSLLQHSHLLTDMPFSKAYPKVMNPMEIRPLIVGSLMGPSSSPSFRQGPGGHIPFSKLPAIELYRVFYVSPLMWLPPFQLLKSLFEGVHKTFRLAIAVMVIWWWTDVLDTMLLTVTLELLRCELRPIVWYQYFRKSWLSRNPS